MPPMTKWNAVRLSRRQALITGGGALSMAALGPLGRGPARAQSPATLWQHGTALIGEPRYPPDFPHFDYVNPDAPKGGTVRLATVGGFDTFNIVISKGSPAPAVALIYDTLMATAFDEPSSMYGLLAEALTYPEDFSWVKYRLRPGARWHDGAPVTPEDVVWSFETWKSLDPQSTFYYSHVSSAEVTGEHEITFTFDQAGNRELPHIVGQLIVLPKHWWEGTDASGKKRDITSGTLEPPLGSGPYRIGSFTAQRTITFVRVDDYWGKDLPVNVGQHNFDEIRFDIYRDTTVLLEAFKGDQYDWRMENSAKNWATGYDSPAVHDKRIILETFPDHGRGVMQAFVVNLRRPKFADARVRQALNYAFNFEEMNQAIFYGQYKRINSYFAGTELACSGLPEGKELEILESVRELVPSDVFTKPYQNPVAGDPQKERENLRIAHDLLQQAGWTIEGRRLVSASTGEPFTIEYLTNNPDFERVILRYRANLQRLGLEVSVRTVDTSQYINRVRTFDFDMINYVWAESLSPGNEQREHWGSQAADREGSRNVAGIKDEAVDRLIDRVIYATDRDDLVAATRALDRVLLWNHFVIPQWYLDAVRTARWDRFGRPRTMPEIVTPAFPQIWWWDKERAARTGGRT